MQKNTSSNTSLKRVLPLPLITLYGIGGIIGAGIYVLIGKIISVSGVLAPFSFLVAAGIALFSAFSFAELASRFPQSAAVVTYLQQGFAMRWLSTLVGLAIVLGGIVSCAAITNGAVAYLQVFINWPNELLLILFLGFITAFSCWGVFQSVTLAAVITAIEIGGILLICFIGAPNLGNLSTLDATLFPDFSWHSWSAIISAALLAFYAYIGFEDIVTMGEEVKNPRKNLPLAIIIALFVTTVLYILVALVFISSLSLSEIAESDAPFTTFIEKNSTLPTSFIGLISLLAITNGALVQIIMSARILYGMAKGGLLPRHLANINPKTRTPVFTTILLGALVMFFAFLLPIETLAKITSYFLLFVFTLVNATLVKVKLTQGSTENSFSVPFFIPVVGFFASGGFFLLQFFA